MRERANQRPGFSVASESRILITVLCSGLVSPRPGLLQNISRLSDRQRPAGDAGSGVMRCPRRAGRDLWKQEGVGQKKAARRFSQVWTFGRLTFLLGVFLGVLVEERPFCFERGVCDPDAERLPLFSTTSSSLSRPAASSSSSLLLCSSFLDGTNSSSSSPSEMGSCWLSRRFLLKQRDVESRRRSPERIPAARTHSCFLMRDDTSWADFLLELLGVAVTGSIGESS